MSAGGTSSMPLVSQAQLMIILGILMLCLKVSQNVKPSTKNSHALFWFPTWTLVFNFGFVFLWKWKIKTAFKQIGIINPWIMFATFFFIFMSCPLVKTYIFLSLHLWQFFCGRIRVCGRFWCNPSLCICVYDVCAQLLNHVWLFAAHGLKPVRLLCTWSFPGTNARVGCHFFPTQGLNLSLLCLLSW